jgi:DNA polymerase III subunit delta'
VARAPIAQEIEADPESDRLDGFPHPRFTRELFGHAGPESLLAEQVASGRMHHGWLVMGPEGIGKATLAYRLARYLLADPSERDPYGQTLAIPAEARAARLVAAGAHPSLLVLRRPYQSSTKKFAQSIPIDEVRRLRGFMSHTVDEGSWRVVIVDQADDLNANSANGILKSLEEPPPRTVFILLSSEPRRLLPTIRSRCRTLDLGALGREDLRRAVTAAVVASEENPPDPADWPRLEELAEGSVRRALSISASGGLKLYERAVGLVAQLPKVDWPQVHALGDELGSMASEQKFHAFFDFLTALIARLVKARATGEGRPHDVDLARRVIRDGMLPAWAEAWEAIHRDVAETLLINLDRKALVLATVQRLEVLARRAAPAR